MKVLLGMHSVLAMQNPRPKLKVLTSLRFLAAFFIFLLHASQFNLISLDNVIFLDFSKSVSFFFVLSGFVLTYAYYRRPISLASFYRSRFLRLWPISFLSILLLLFLLPHNLYPPFPGSRFSALLVFISNVLCLQSLIPIPTFYFGFNSVNWSISTELVFYGLFPFLFSKTIRFLLFSLVAIISSILLLSLFILHSGISFYTSSNLDSFSLHGLIYINPLFRLPEFIFGILACRLYMLPCFHKFAHNIIRLHKQFGIYFDYFLSISLFLLFFLAFLRISCGLIPSISICIFFSQIKSGFIFSLFILILLSSNCLFVRILSIPPFVLLGEISFSFYLFHQPILIFFSHKLAKMHAPISYLSSNFFIVLIFVFAVSSLAYYVIERPLGHLFRIKYAS